MSHVEPPPSGEPDKGERHVSEVAGKGRQTFSGTQFAGFIAAGAALLVALVLLRHPEHKSVEAPSPLQVGQHARYVPPPPLPFPEDAAATQPKSAALISPVPAPAPQDDPLARSRIAPVLEFSGASGAAGPAAGAAAETGAPAISGPSDLAAHLTATQMEGAKATLLPHRDLLITEGTVIPCILETALDSTLPGLATCMVPRTILSDTGTVELLEKGTKIVGEYQGGMRQGQERVFILWTRAETPHGAIIKLASPASDALGRSGVDGVVDTHFWQRFGGALLLSIVDDAAVVAQSGVQGGSNNSSYYGATTSAGQQAAAVALQNTINIPPTLRKNQGEAVSIFVARDLDFSGVYELKPIPGHPEPTAYSRNPR